ncbi:MAG: Flp pilus assembly protein TadD [Crocinitomicaceae bacterium]|jgi:Flp pilus assembly protein TadD
MKKQSFKRLAFVAVVGTLVSSCATLGDLEYTVTPCPLEMHGDMVKVKVDVVVPEKKGIGKKIVAEITPTLGGVALKSITIQGPKATGNGIVIDTKTGGKFTYEDEIAYAPAFENSELMVTGTISKNGKKKDDIDPFKICDGTIITPWLVNKDYKVTLATDNFERTTNESTAAQLNYAKGKSDVRSTELKDDDIKAYGDWLASAQTNPKIAIKNVAITGFASPEGEEDKNGTLSKDRSESAAVACKALATKAENETAAGEIYSLSSSGSDYPGFKKALLADEKMKEDEKQLILRVLDMSTGPDQIEVELRNMRQTFTYLDRSIFPLLRRSEIKTSYVLTGFSDEELKSNSVSNPDTLNLEELLFTAGLYDDLSEKLRVYMIAEARFGDDYRPSNNVGAILYMQNKVSEAKAKFTKAAGIKDNPITSNNLGAIAGVEGDRVKARSLLNQGSGAETNYNHGILDVLDGEYGDAVSHLGSDASFNKALAEMLNGNASAVNGIVNNSADAETAQGYYLKAVAAARQDKLDDAVNNIKSAIAKDGSYKAKAAKDREFLKYFENASFTAIVK